MNRFERVVVGARKRAAIRLQFSERQRKPPLLLYCTVCGEEVRQLESCMYDKIDNSRDSENGGGPLNEGYGATYVKSEYGQRHIRYGLWR